MEPEYYNIWVSSLRLFIITFWFEIVIIIVVISILLLLLVNKHMKTPKNNKPNPFRELCVESIKCEKRTKKQHETDKIIRCDLIPNSNPGGLPHLIFTVRLFLFCFNDAFLAFGSIYIYGFKIVPQPEYIKIRNVQRWCEVQQVHFNCAMRFRVCVNAFNLW